MDSKEPFNGFVNDSEENNLETLLSKAYDTVNEGGRTGDKNLVFKGIEMYQKALGLIHDPHKTIYVNCCLGESFLILHTVDNHKREYFDSALQHFSSLKSADDSFFVFNNGVFKPEDLLFAAYVFREHYVMFGGDSGKINTSISFAKKVISLIEEFHADVPELLGRAYHELGLGYHELYRKNRSRIKDLDEAIINLNRSIRVNNFLFMHEKEPVTDIDPYYNCANALYDRWVKQPSKQDLLDAKKCLFASFDIVKRSKTSFNIYHLLRDVFYAEDNKVEGDQCINTLLYLLFTKRAEWQYCYYNVSHMIPSSQLYDSLKYLKLNKRTRGLTEKDIEQFLPNMDFLILLQFFYWNMEDEGILRYKPIFQYYLGGVVSSYISLDEFLSNNQNQGKTLQEYYYYVRSAISFYDYKGSLIQADSKLTSIVSAVIQQGQLGSYDDLYYMGQLTYLLALRVNDGQYDQKLYGIAKHCFEQCTDNIWAKAMLDVINGEKGYTPEVAVYIKNNCSNPKTVTKEQINSLSFLGQLSDYFHFNEVYFACPQYFSRIIGLGPDLEFYKPLWEVFRLTKADYELLTLQLREILGRSIQQEIAIQAAMAVRPISDEEFHRIENDLVDYTKLENSNDVESKAQSFIRDSKMVWADKVVLLRHLFKQNLISCNQYFTLLKYNEYCKSVESEQKTLNKVTMDIVAICGFIAGQMLFNDKGLSGLVTQLLARHLIKIEIEQDNYYSFKNGLWIVINNEYLTEDQYLYID